MKGLLMTIPTKLAAAALLAGLLIVPAAAAVPDAQAQAVAEKLVQIQFDIMQPARLAQQMAQGMSARIEQTVRQQQPGKDDAYYQRAAQIVVHESDAANQELIAENLPALRASLIAMLTTRFTLDELNDMYRYQSSPTGRKAMQVTAEEMPRLMQPFMQKIMQSAPQVAQRVEAALKRAGYDLH